MVQNNIVEEQSSQPEQPYILRFTDPETLVSNLGIEAGSVVADFGCASGFFSLPIAKKIGEEGVVYSLDILPQSLELIASQAKAAGLTNIVTKRVNLEKVGGSKLPDESCDWVIMKDMLFQNRDKLMILAEAHRVLKSGGRALVIEWGMHESAMGPDKSLRISEEALIEIIQKAGMRVLNKIPVSNFHYGFVIIK